MSGKQNLEAGSPAGGAVRVPWRRRVRIACLLVAAVSCLATRAGAAEDLSGWGQEEVCNVGFVPIPWVLEPGNTRVRTEQNNNCAQFFRDDLTLTQGTMTIGHTGPPGDNDYFGVALGFDPGDATSANADYLMLEWEGPNVMEGLALVHVKGALPSGSAIHERVHTAGFASTELARATTLGHQAWAFDTLYQVRVVLFAVDRLIVEVDGVTQFDLSPHDVGLSCFPVGGLAFYNFSQAWIHYGDIESTGDDYDFDGILDASDNCAFVANPLQENADGDCAGDACDPCGNGVVDDGEQCDLGPDNCATGDSCDTCTRSCDDTCHLTGRCSGSGECCTTAADCGVGEGCCGNGALEAGEACDDGNRLSGDCCSSTCQAEGGSCVPAVCCPRGAELAGATVLARKKVKLTRLGGAAGDEQLKSTGEAILLPGQDVHPCDEGVSYCLEDANGVVYGPTPVDVANPQVGGEQIATCTDTPSPRRVRAKYTDRGRPPVNSDPDGLKLFDVKNVASQPNKYKYKVLLRDVNLSAASPPTVLRQSLVIGDTCLVLKLVCTPAGTSTAICVPTL